MVRHLINLPTPKKISYFWNFGSMLGFSLMIQVFSGILLCLSYVAMADVSFGVIDQMIREVGGGDFARSMHANGASFFFFFLYLHTGRSIYFKSYKKKIHVWSIGMTIFLMSMAIAFLGYVLPWGKMSFWGATVITKLFSVIPIMGTEFTQWLWGGFSVNSATLTRFFGLHVIFPLGLCMVVVVHILLLHKTGSSNPVGVSSEYSTFHPFFTYKDIFGILIMCMIWVGVALIFPFIFMDAENFMEANPLVTPIHIQPEWYFLPAYAVLRSIPKKLGGVMSLLMVFLIFFMKPFFFSLSMKPSLSKLKFWLWVAVKMGLMWMGACSVEGLYMILGQIFTVLYFILVMFLFLQSQKSDVKFVT